MPNVSQLIRFRRQQRARELRRPWSKIGLVSGILISLLAVILTVAGLWWTIDLTKDLPSIDKLAALLEPPNGSLLQPTRLYDRTHDHIILTLENPAAAGKQYLRVGKNGQEGANQVSPYLVDATTAELDPDFWNHHGYTLVGISEGTHPTVAQRLISDLVLENEPPSISRSIRERLLAAQVTAKYGREKVLEWYLNNAQYGDLIYGIDSAAKAYFGKSATNLSLAESAMLVAVAEMPSIDPSTGSTILKQQQELIIQKMLVDGYITGEETRKALNEALQYQVQTETPTVAPAFTEQVLMQLSSVMPLERIRRGGFEIITSLDYELQSQADCAVKIQLARIQGTEPNPATFDGSPCEASHLLPTLQTVAETPSEDLKAEVVILDPKSGQILAMVGDAGAGVLPSNQGTHPAGSITSPFLYLTAFTRGMSPANLLWDLPSNNGADFSIPEQNDLTRGSTASYQGPVSLRKAFANDYPGAAAEVLAQVGAENVQSTENQFGINTLEVIQNIRIPLENLYSQPLTLLESVQAYAVLANLGVMSGQPGLGNVAGNSQNKLGASSVLSVVGADGEVWLDWTTPQELPVVSPQIAYLTTNVLSDEKARWPTLGHPNALEIGRPAGAKVSLNAEASDAWAVGYITQLAIGVWMGHSTDEVGGITSEMPAGVWHALMQYATSQMLIQDFTIPEGISRVQVCDPSGMLVTPLCPVIAQEVFLAGNEPTQVDNLYRKFFVNRETGLLATLFTPSELVDEKVYLDVSPEALDWAKQSGLPISPEIYDDISPPSSASEEVQLSSPKMVDYVSGQLVIKGSAGGEGFAYYRLQVGEGLYPQEWIQIGEDVDHPVMEGFLGTWDTRGVEGIYVVELLVVRQDKRVDRAMIQVTVDNVAPRVQILSPIVDEQFSSQLNPTIIINVSASDNLAVQRVEYYIDNKLESTLFEPPWITLWTAQPDEHILTVKAYDLAGNASEGSTAFFMLK